VLGAGGDAEAGHAALDELDLDAASKLPFEPAWTLLVRWRLHRRVKQTRAVRGRSAARAWPTSAGGWRHKGRETPDAAAGGGAYRRRMARQTYLVENYRPTLAVETNRRCLLEAATEQLVHELCAPAGIPLERIQPAIVNGGGTQTS
jgi:hypothetical protein